MCHVFHKCHWYCCRCCALPYDLRNSSVFSARLNASSDDSDVIAGGSMFQTFAAATGKARSPMVRSGPDCCIYIKARKCFLNDM